MTKPYILIIEDDEKIKTSIEDTAHSLGYLCDWASNQEDAIRLVGENNYVMVLLDLQIPARPLRTASVDYGCNCLEQIRHAKDKKTLPVIVMTAHTERGLDLAVRLMGKGATDFISKPFPDSGRTLSKVLQENLRLPIPKGQDVPQQFQGGELVIYPDRATLLGIEILGKRAANSEIKMLRVLSVKQDGRYPNVSAAKMGSKIGTKIVGNACSWARMIRNAASRKLKERNIVCGKYDVIPETTGRGYCLKDWIVARIENPTQPTIPDTGGLEPKTRKKEDRQKWLFELFVEDGSEMTTAAIMAKWSCSEKTVYRDIEDLQKKGVLIELISGTTWRLKKRI